MTTLSAKKIGFKQSRGFFDLVLYSNYYVFLNDSK